MSASRSSLSCEEFRRQDPAPSNEDLVLALPYLIGFPPVDSLVAVFWGLMGDVVLTARINWADVVAEPMSIAAGLADTSRLSGASGTCCVAADTACEAEAAWPLLRAVSTAMRNRGLVSVPELVVGSGRWKSSGCADDCPAAGHEPVAGYVPALVAGIVTGGRGPLPDRDAVAAEVASLGASRSDLMRERVTSELAGAVDIEAWRDRVVDETIEILRRPRRFDADRAAVVACACMDVRVRDTVLWRLSRLALDTHDLWDHVWATTSEVLRHARGESVAPVAALAAISAWQCGDGLRAGFALDRAHEADPAHNLSSLIRRSLDRGLPPEGWRLIMLDLTEEECRWGDDFVGGAVACEQVAGPPAQPGRRSASPGGLH